MLAAPKSHEHRTDLACGVAFLFLNYTVSLEQRRQKVSNTNARLETAVGGQRKILQACRVFTTQPAFGGGADEIACGWKVRCAVSVRSYRAAHRIYTPHVASASGISIRRSGQEEPLGKTDLLTQGPRGWSPTKRVASVLLRAGRSPEHLLVRGVDEGRKVGRSRINRCDLKIACHQRIHSWTDDLVGKLLLDPQEQLEQKGQFRVLILRLARLVGLPYAPQLLRRRNQNECIKASRASKHANERLGAGSRGGAGARPEWRRSSERQFCVAERRRGGAGALWGVRSLERPPRERSRIRLRLRPHAVERDCRRALDLSRQR